MPRRSSSDPQGVPPAERVRGLLARPPGWVPPPEPGVAAADGALIAHATRRGTDPAIRERLAESDAEWRSRNKRRPLEALFGQREPGAGRPTKRDRRQIERQLGRRG